MKHLKALLEQYKTNKRCKQLVKSWAKSYIEPKSRDNKHSSFKKVVQY